MLKKIALSLMITTSGFATNDAEKSIDYIFSFLEQGAQQDYIGEAVSQLEHALQAAQLAEDAGMPEFIIIAALLHDIGHLCAPSHCEQMNGFGVSQHEVIGAQFLLDHGFSPEIAQLVQGHVLAKRYLTFADPDYYNKLSPSSKETLKLQGGPMTAREAETFKNSPLFREKLLMRFWDEKAKVKGAHVHPLEYYREMCLRHLMRKK